MGVDRVEQFMQRRNVEVSLSYHIMVVTLLYVIAEYIMIYVIDIFVRTLCV